MASFRNPFADKKEKAEKAEPVENKTTAPEEIKAPAKDLSSFSELLKEKVEAETSESPVRTSENTPVSPRRSNRNTIPTIKRGTGGLPTVSNDPLSELLADFDTEAEDLYRAKSENRLSNNRLDGGEDLTIIAIEKRIKELDKKYPTGGIKASRVIDANILINAPRGYFKKFSKDVTLVTRQVRDALANNDQSELIRRAQNNPTDEAQQDASFYPVNSVASEYTSKTIWNGVEKKIFLSLVCNEILGFGVLDPLWRDRSINEIACSGPDEIRVEIKGEWISVPGCSFDSPEHLESLIARLYQPLGKVLSPTTPLLKGRLHDKSRMYSVHRSIDPTGPVFNIRRHQEKVWLPSEMVKRGVATEEMMTEIGNLVRKGASYIINGGTGSGKTTMLNTLTGFYKDATRVVTAEDNLEMKPNPRKYIAAAMECRDPSMDKPNDQGVTLKDLVRACTQITPDVIIVGEVTDEAAFYLCQALNTGHAGASSVHSNSSSDAIVRLSSLIAQGGITSIEGALDMIASAFDIIITVKSFLADGSRRIVSIDEVNTHVNMESGRPELHVRQLWRFVDQGIVDGKVTGYFEKVSDISDERKKMKFLDLEEDISWDELEELSRFEEKESVTP